MTWHLESTSVNSVLSSTSTTTPLLSYDTRIGCSIRWAAHRKYFFVHLFITVRMNTYCNTTKKEKISYSQLSERNLQYLRVNNGNDNSILIEPSLAQQQLTTVVTRPKWHNTAQTKLYKATRNKTEECRAEDNKCGYWLMKIRRSGLHLVVRGKHKNLCQEVQ